MLSCMIVRRRPQAFVGSVDLVSAFRIGNPDGY